jgi:hypothetical protein
MPLRAVLCYAVLCCELSNVLRHVCTSCGGALVSYHHAFERWKAFTGYFHNATGSVAQTRGKSYRRIHLELHRQSRI